VIDGHVKAVPRAIMAAVQILSGARGGVDLPQRDVRGVRSVIGRYYDKMRESVPWKKAA
jgi:hypothetical protein